ncbi:MAG: phage BR0599 family protein [Burkholderiaceae bacterium]|nr:phage BR0599 family protein [Burkholderiaceae bacterium]
MLIDLYTFSSPQQTQRWTSSEFTVADGAQTYAPLPLKRDTVSQGMDAAKAAVTLKVPPTCGLVLWLMEAAASGEQVSVTIARAQASTPDSGAQISGVQWIGRVSGVESADDGAVVRCESALVSLKRIGLRRLYSRSCTHVLYGPACGAALRSEAATLFYMPDPLHMALAAQPAALNGALGGGWVQLADGRRWMIVEQTGAQLTLLHPAQLDTNQAVTLVAGCDHSTAVCQGRFSNLDNFGGFPSIPGANPFNTTLF